MKKLSVLTALLFAAVSAQADVKLNPIFDDHAVLQRDIPVAVYGKAEPGEKVTVAFAGQTQSVTADKDGAWCVKLAAMKACTNSATMTVTGKNTLTLKDVVVGDVWICSGQSNMDFTPGAYHNALDPKPYDEKDFDVPLLRQCHLVNEPSMRPVTDLIINRGNGTSQESATWLPCKPTTGNRFTAVGLYFGRKLQLETGVPIIDDPSLRCCDGIWCDPKTDKIYLGNWARNSIHIYDARKHTLQMIWENDDTDGRDGLLDQPCSACLLDNKLIIVNFDMPFPGLKNTSHEDPITVSYIDIP